MDKPREPVFHLEPLCMADAAFRWEVFVATIKPYIDAIFGWDEMRQRGMVIGQLAAGTHCAIVVNGERAGIVQIEESPEAISLSQIEILPHAQGRGIGTAIIHMLMARAAVEGKTVSLQVFRENHAARRLYDRLGFVVVTESGHDVEMIYTP